MAFDILITACQKLIEEYGDFWLLAALTDRSYEEGVRNKGFAESVRSFEAIGVSQAVVDQLRRGINGNMATIISGIDGVIGEVKQNRSRVPDIRFRTSEGDVFVESKLIYDCTYLKYYPPVAEDGRKLLERKSSDRRLFQVVFFVQLPGYTYPDGFWYGNKWAKRRVSWVVKGGVDAQYRFLLSHMPGSPAWPVNEPYVHRLQFPTDEVDEVLLDRWYSQVFKPDKAWDFDPGSQVKDAAVGVTVWDYSA